MAVETQTIVTAKEMSFDDILGTPGSENILLPAEEKNKPKPQANMFAREPDASFLDNQEVTSEEDEAEESAEESSEEETEETGTESTADVLGAPGTTSEEEKPETGKINKGAMIKALQDLVDKKVITPFDDGKALKDYSIADVQELIEANLKDREEKIREEFPQEFFQSLPDEFQVAVEYLSKGGQDMKGLFRALAGVQETKELDAKNPSHQENIIRQYLRAAKFGSEEDITEEIDGWKDRGELENKALKFKPKLDKMQEDNVSAQIAHQEEINAQRQVAAKTYMSSVYNALEKGKLGDIELDSKTQSMLYGGLVQPNYPSMSGKSTNLLGHLLEKYQYTKDANPALVAEVLYLLADPEGYRAKVKEAGSKAATQKTVRLLKTEESAGKKGLGLQNDQEDNSRSKKSNGLHRATQNFFQRPKL